MKKLWLVEGVERVGRLLWMGGRDCPRKTHHPGGVPEMRWGLPCGIQGGSLPEQGRVPEVGMDRPNLPTTSRSWIFPETNKAVTTPLPPGGRQGSNEDSASP